jgi:hypothetical protein
MSCKIEFGERITVDKLTVLNFRHKKQLTQIIRLMGGKNKVRWD